MVKYIDVEKLKAEIERRNLANYCETAEQYEEELLAILDTIPEQPVEGLEEEIDRLWESFSEEMSGPHNLFDMYRRLVRHFAEWGRKQVLQEIYDGKVKPVDKITAAWLDDEQNI